MKKLLSILLIICLMFTTVFPALAAGDDVNVNLDDQAPTTNVVFSDFNDFSDTSVWKLNQSSAAARVSFKDEDGDGVKDYVSLTSGANKNTYISSRATTLVPGTEYELSFYLRVPADSASYITESGSKSAPEIIIYQPDVDSETGLVTTAYSEGNNEYAYKNKRRHNFSAEWQIGDYAPYTRSNYSSFAEASHYAACEISPNEVYSDWTKVTATFTAIDDTNNIGNQVVSFSIGVPSRIADVKLDIKNLTLIDKSIVLPDPETQKTILTSDFGSDTNWTIRGYVSYKDEDTDGVNDYARLKCSSTAQTALKSTPVQIVPGKDYELTFYARIPEDSKKFQTETYNYYPEFSMFQPTNIVDGKVQDNYSNATAYAYKGTRRDDFVSTWQIGDLDPVSRNKYSSFSYNLYAAVYSDTTVDQAFNGWTKVTYKFTGLASAENNGPETVAFYFSLPKDKTANAEGCLFDIKDVKLIENPDAAPETPDEPEVPDEPENPVIPEAPEGAVYYETFENQTDETVENIITNRSWSEPFISTSEAASGSKSLGIRAYYEYLFIPIDKALIEQGKIYEFSMDWKMAQYTETKKREINRFHFIAYNPSKGETIQNNAVAFTNMDGTIKATGNWINSKLRLKVSDLNAYEQYGIYLRYKTSTPYDETDGGEDTLFIDNILLKVAEDQSALNPIKITEEERTEDTIKVLAFGNSFSNDGTTFIPQIAAADGTDIRVGDCSIGGCALLRHYSNMINGTADYTFRYRQPSGTKGVEGVTMYQALTATDWDYITIQQVSGNSGKIDTFEPYLSELIAYFKEVCPDAKILFHMTWAYAQDSTHTDFVKYNSSQSEMYEAIEDTYIEISKNYDFAPIIPSGEAIKRVRDTVVGDTLNRDGFHLNDRGRIIAALTWYETFTGISALDTKFDFQSAKGTLESTANQLLEITEDEEQIFRTAAHEAATHFKKARETQLAIEAIDEVITLNSGNAIENAEALRAELNDDDLLPNLQTLIDARADYKNLLENSVIPGDINGSHTEADLEDVNLLAQYMAGWNVEALVNEEALDVNGDGAQNLKDLVLLAQYVAGWDIELFNPTVELLYVQ